MLPDRNKFRQLFAPAGGIIARCLLLAVIFVLAASRMHAADQDRSASLRSSIIALDSARKTALGEFENLSLSPAETSDYRDFIAYLNTRIVIYCKDLAEQAGHSSLEELPCPAGTATSGGGGPLPAGGAEIFYTTGAVHPGTPTRAEKTAELDKDLLSAMGDFDEMLLKEEDKVAARVPSQRETGTSADAAATGSGGSPGESGEAGSTESGSPGEQATSGEGDQVASGGEKDSAAGSGSQSGTGTANGNLGQAAYGAPGGTLPPPQDDDIVARQLREAAEKEPDPELKKKLWEEYWKYKGRRTSGG